MAEPYPLVTRFPALATLPRVALCTLPTPVVRAELDAPLWIKNDALSAPVAGGNKVRALEFLLARVEPGDTVLTVGGAGSTQVLATAVHAARLGAGTVAVRWRHEMNETADRVHAIASARCERAPVRAAAPIALATAMLLRLRATRRARLHYVPAGAATPLGVLGSVSAMLELSAQIARGEAPPPDRIVVALGTGGTMAGLALGAAVAGLDCTIVGVQVTPRILANMWRVQRLVARTARLIERVTGERVPRPRPERLQIDRALYRDGYGAYGREHPLARELTPVAERVAGVRLDQTYTAKAFAAAVSSAAASRGSTLFWHTFDARLLDRA